MTTSTVLYTPSPELLHFTEQWEGVIPHWYQDIAKVWTGGAGHVALGDERSRIVAPFSALQIDTWLQGDVAKAVAAVRALIAKGVPLGQHQGDALTDACFNCGTGLLAQGNRITQALMRQDWLAAGDALLEWCHFRRDGVVYTNTGLRNRRMAERAMLFTPDPAHYTPDTTGYEACSAGALCNPDDPAVREIINRGAALWLGEQPDYGHRELPETD